jgi:hypothetical protein
VQADEFSVVVAGESPIRARDLLLAVGAGAARRARARFLEPLAATVSGVLQLGTAIVTENARHTRVAELAARGEDVRAELEQAARETARRALRWSVERALTALDLTELVLVHVDLDELAAGIDVDAVVARTDLDAAIDNLDLNAVLARVDVDTLLSRVDLEAVLERIDLNEIASRIDLDTIVSHVDLDAILERVDVNEVASRIDLDTIVSHVDLDAILKRVDVNEVASRIDLDAIVSRVEPDAVVARVDIDAVIARLDLAALAREVIDAIDLPEILRQSSGAVSSQAARVVRTEGMNADESVARFVDRVLRRTTPRVP